jgi:hypothetical protein
MLAEKSMTGHRQQEGLMLAAYEMPCLSLNID